MGNSQLPMSKMASVTAHEGNLFRGAVKRKMLNALQGIDFMTQRNYRSKRTSTVKPSRDYIKSINKGFGLVYVSLLLVCFSKNKLQ